MSWRVLGSGVVVVAVVAAAGCSGGSDDGGFPSSAGRSSFEGRLELIPASAAEVNDGDSGVTVVMADLDRAAELAGVERPEDPADTEAVVDYVNPMTGYAPGQEVPPAVAALLPEASSYQTALARQDEFVEEVGWSLLDVSWFVEYQVYPAPFTVMGGDFDEDRLTEALGEREGDIWQIGEEDLGQDGEPTVARRIGEHLRLALDDGRLIVARATPPVEDALDGANETLADDPTLRALATALDDEEVYSAMLVTGRSFEAADSLGGRPLPPDVLDRLEESEEEEPVLLPEPFGGVAEGLAYEDDRAVAVFVYSHDDEDAAEANAAALQRIVEDGQSVRIRQPWSERFSVDEIRTEGTTVVARLGVPSDRPVVQLYDVLQNADSLVTHW